MLFYCSCYERDVGREDGGMYQCIAGNEEEESQAVAQLVLGGELTPFSVRASLCAFVRASLCECVRLCVYV